MTVLFPPHSARLAARRLEALLLHTQALSTPEWSSFDSGMGQMDQTRWREKRAKFAAQFAALETRAHHGVLDLRLRILTKVSDIMLDSELSEETSGRLELVLRHDAGSLSGVLPGFVR
jgi:hypothetical protein